MNMLYEIIVFLFISFVVLYINGKTKKNKKNTFENKESNNNDKYTLENAKKFIEETIQELTSLGMSEKGLSIDEYNKRKNIKSRLTEAIKNAPCGDINSKTYVKEYIADLLVSKKYGLDEQNIDNLLNFNNIDRLTIRDKFDILLHNYFKKYQYDAFEKLVFENKLDELKIIDRQEYFCITPEEIENIYSFQIKDLNYVDKLDIITQRIYSDCFGLGCIDDIRDMKIDGVSGGVSGLTGDYINMSKLIDLDDLDYISQFGSLKQLPRNYDSVWIFFKGKNVHLKFLSFESEEELVRVCENIFLFDNPGELSQSDGYKINEMADGSRVLVTRPPFTESWVFFVRKFDTADAELEPLVSGEFSGIKIENAEFAVDTLSFIIKGGQTTAITGQQGTGKTTLLLALIKKIYAFYSLRIEEMFFELHARTKLLNWNILTFKEVSELLNGQKALDVMKKTDGTVTIVSEVAEDPVAANMIQASQVASLFTLFCHHAKTLKDLILSLRNSLLKTNMFSNETLAEEQVVQAIRFDTHLDKAPYGLRYVARVTECIPVDDEDYPTDFRNAKTIEEKLNAFMETALVYFKKVTGRKTFTESNILEFDPINRKYIAVNKFSSRVIKDMKKNMLPKDQVAFDKYLNKYFHSEDGDIN